MAALWAVLKQFHTTKVADLAEVAERVTTNLRPRTILLLEGPVGAGKTEFVKALALTMGIADAASPSYAIHHHYENGRGQGFDHVDLYRLEGEEELEGTGFWDLFQTETGFVVIEWPERVDVDQLPMNWCLLKIQIEKNETENERTLTLFKR